MTDRNQLKNDILIYVKRMWGATVSLIHEHVGGTPEMVWALLYELDNEGKVSVGKGYSGKFTADLPDDWEIREVIIRN